MIISLILMRSLHYSAELIWRHEVGRPRMSTSRDIYEIANALHTIVIDWCPTGLILLLSDGIWYKFKRVY